MKTILVIDDDFSMRRGIAFLLKREGYRVLEAEDRIHALALLPGKNIELIIVDLFLEGQNGLELVEEIRESNAKVKLLIITAYGEHNRAAKARETFKENYLDKVDLEKMLLPKVRKLLHEDLIL